jgi:guanine deaminase
MNLSPPPAPSQEGNDFLFEGATPVGVAPSSSLEMRFPQGAGDVSPQKNYASSMAIAIDEARAGMAAGHGGPFGAVVLQGETIVGRGHNRVLSSHDPTAHAEVTALRDAAKTLGTHVLSDCVLVTTCEPCPMCFSAAFWSRVDGIVYAATRHDAAAVGFDDAKLYDILGSKGREPFEKKIITPSGEGVGGGPFLLKIHTQAAVDLFAKWKNSDKKELY